jgi:hypothetical protein
MSLRDPTRSAGIRRAGRAIVERRVFELKRELQQTVQQHDLIGLRQRETVPASLMLWAEQPEQKLARGVDALARMVRHRLSNPPDWLTGVVERAVNRGLEQVAQELKAATEHLDASEVVGFQAMWASNEVEGISSETQRRTARHVARAIQVRQTPDFLMRDIRMTLEKITRARLILLVNTAVVRSVNAGKLYGYEANGITRVGVRAEHLPQAHFHDHAFRDKKKRKSKSRMSVSQAGLRARAILTAGLRIPELPMHVKTAGDDKVCDVCSEISADGPYEMDIAFDLIPAHPNCRCAFVAYGSDEYAEMEYERYEDYDDDEDD